MTLRVRSTKVILMISAVTLAVTASAIFANYAYARSCSPLAWTPWRSANFEITGDADAQCNSSGETQTLYMAVHKAQNNWPDPRVCRDSRYGQSRFFGKQCDGPFKRGKYGLYRGKYYTYATANAGQDYSPTRYLVPG